MFMMIVWKRRKNIKLVTVLAVIVSGTIALAADPLPKPRRWACHGTVCIENVHFCSVDMRMCELCEDYKQYCSTNLQPQNCTQYCMTLHVEAGCDIPENTPNGYFNTSGHKPYQSTAHFYCKDGYRSGTDSQEIVCGDFGKWNSQPECVAIVCPAPNIPKNAKIVPGAGYGSDYRVGQEVDIRCEDDYNLEGSATITCGVDGHWEPAVFPACYPKSDCPVWKNSFFVLSFFVLIGICSILFKKCLGCRFIQYLKGHNYQSPQDRMRNPGTLDDQDEDAAGLLERRSDNTKDEEIELKSARCSRTKSRQRRASYTDDDDSQAPIASPPANGAAMPAVNINIHNHIAPTATANATANTTVNNEPTDETNRANENEGNLGNDGRYDPFPIPETGNGDNQRPACRPEGHDPVRFPPSSELPGIKRNGTEARQPHDNDSLRAPKVGLDDCTINMDDIPPEMNRNVMEARQPDDNDSLRAKKVGIHDRTINLDDIH